MYASLNKWIKNAPIGATLEIFNLGIARDNMIEEKIASDLLKIKAVFLRPEEPFTWASGIKSPIYCDNRLTLSDVAVREDVENGLAETIRRE